MSSESSGFGELHSVNPANKFLGYLQAGPGRIGFVDEVNGAGGVDANGYVPTVFELTILARHWWNNFYDIDVFWFSYDTWASDEARRRTYAQVRLGEIRRVGGKELLWKVEDEVKEAMRKQYGENFWDCYLRNDKAGARTSG